MRAFSLLFSLALLRSAAAATAEQWRERSIYQCVLFIPLLEKPMNGLKLDSSSIGMLCPKVLLPTHVIQVLKHGVCGKIARNYFWLTLFVEGVVEPGTPSPQTWTIFKTPGSQLVSKLLRIKAGVADQCGSLDQPRKPKLVRTSDCLRRPIPRILDPRCFATERQIWYCS